MSSFFAATSDKATFAVFLAVFQIYTLVITFFLNNSVNFIARKLRVLALYYTVSMLSNFGRIFDNIKV